MTSFGANRLSNAGCIIRLQSPWLEVSVLPDIGAKIFDLVHRPTGHNFLWHNPRIVPQPYPIEANFDNYWCGGWDDGFPTCETCSHAGEVYPNLGELRSVRWRVEAFDTSSTEPFVTLSGFGPISPVEATKTIKLTGESIEMEFHIRHIGYLPIDFIWGTHPAYCISPDCVIHIPARTGIVSQASRPALGAPGQRYGWPNLLTVSSSTDMSRTMPAGEFAAGHYVTDLDQGWYALEYPSRQLGILFEFPLETCPYLWLWLSYGGWRGYYLAVIEPWTSCPVTLSDAVAANTHRVLSCGETFSCKVRATAWTNPQTLDRLLATRRTR